MGFYSEKPIRVDYYPKTKETVDEFEKLEIEDSPDNEAVCKITDEKELVREEIIKCSGCMFENIEVMEEAAEEATDGMEKVIEEMTEDVKEITEEETEDKEED